MKGGTYIDKVTGETLYMETLRGVVFYFKDEAISIFHRVDGPAKKYDDGNEVWLQNNKRHRMDGPAVDWHGVKEWWINGVRLTYTKGDYYRGPYLLRHDLHNKKK